ncbi:MAG: PAS domain-containing protein, partial [Bacteroidota bacterium]
WEFMGMVDEEGKIIGLQGLGHDISGERQSAYQLQKISRLNQHLLAISVQFMEVEQSSLHDAIQQALKTITQFLGFQRGLVYTGEVEQEELQGHLAYDYSNPTLFSLSDKINRLSLKNFLWLKQQVLSGQPFEVSGVKSLPQEAYRETLLFRLLNIESLLAIPIIYQRKLRGYVLFVSSTKIEPQADELLKSIKTLGTILGSVFHHVRLSRDSLNSRTQYKLLADNATDMVSKHDLTGIYNYVSPSSENLTGFKSSELLGASAFEFIHPDDRAKAKEHLKKTLSGSIVHHQYRKRNKNGEYNWVEVTSKLIEDKGKKEIIASTRNIHQQKLAEQANAKLLTKSQKLNKRFRESQKELELTLFRTQELNELLLKSEKKFRSLTEKSFDAVMMYNTEGIITYASPSVVNVIGYSSEELVGTYARSYIFPEDLTLVQEVFRNAITQPQQRFSSLSRIICKNGEVIWIESIMTNLLMDENIQGLVSNFRDVTKQRKNEQAIKDYSERLAIATESANIGIWDWLIPQDQIVWDERTLQMFGIAPKIKANYKELWKEIIHPADLQRMRSEIDLALKGEQGYDIEYRIIRQDNRQVRYIKSHAKVTFSDGEPVRMTGINLDITTLKNTEKQLRDNVEALEKSNAELDHFVYSTSHNLRSPLASVLGLISVLKGTDNVDEQEQYLQLIEDSIHKLDGTIQKIIDYSRNSRMALTIEPIHFQKIIAEILDGLYFLRNTIDIRVDLDIANDLAFFSDSSRIRTIFNNLLANAIKYFNPYVEQPFVSISVQPHQEGVKIIVKDNGVGIERRAQEKVFDMFFRATSRASGSGLGLYIVKETALMLGGNVFLASQKGEGTTFTLYLPSLDKDTQSN